LGNWLPSHQAVSKVSHFIEGKSQIQANSFGVSCRPTPALLEGEGIIAATLGESVFANALPGLVHEVAHRC
jgi:hypothetical protein